MKKEVPFWILLATSLILGVALWDSDDSKEPSYIGHPDRTGWVIYRIDERGHINTRVGVLYLDSLMIIEHE